jgi:AcrR family transcriptional regulator
MGTASSALYRYFASSQELLGARYTDAYDALADALAAARDAQPPDDPARQWWAICHAWRRWSLEHPADFALIFGTPVPGYQAPVQVTGPATGRPTAIPLQVLTTAVKVGAADTDRTQVPPTLQLGQLLRELLDQASADYPPRLAGMVLTAWASPLGFLVAEVFGSLTRLVADSDQLYGAHLRSVMVAMGFDPTLVDTADRPGR